jgi:serralysin
VDILTGGAGRDFLEYDFDVRTVGINIDLLANTIVNNNAGAAIVDIISGFEDVSGTGFADIMRGTDGDNNFIGRGGSDVFYGRLGYNFYEGGAGADTFYGGTGTGNNQWDEISYQVNGGFQGIVVTFLGGGALSVVDNFADTDTGFGIESVRGSALSDVFNGSADNESVQGLAGNDTFNLGGGQDYVSYDTERYQGSTRGVIVNLSAAAITRTSVSAQ